MANNKLVFQTDQLALDRLYQYATNSGAYSHDEHLQAEAAYEQISEQLARLEGLMK
jgi:hypothetical protein